MMDYRKMKEPQPKFKVGDEIYFYVDYEQAIYSFKIASLIYDQDGTNYFDSEDEFCIGEERAYATCEELIDANIEFWKGLKNEETSTCSKNVSMECEHEYTTQSGFACAKCGYNAVKDGGADSDTDCAHESDGYAYALGKSTGVKLPSIPRTPHNYKCKKCGEFYR